MAAASVDPGVLTLLRRHSTEGTLCDNVECAMDDPNKLDVVGDPDEFGFVGHVRCTVCGQLMSTKCYDDANRKKIRVLSANELKAGDHIAWHNAIGTSLILVLILAAAAACRFSSFDSHWHNVIFLKSLGMESDNVTSRISAIQYAYSGCCKNKVVESVLRLDFFSLDVYRIVYVDAYTDGFSIQRARLLTGQDTNIHALLGGCEYLARWCKTGHRASKLRLVIQKLTLESHEMKVVHKLSTFFSLALADGIIPDASSEVKVVEAVLFTIIPTIVLFFSVVVAQIKQEYINIEPRRENMIVHGRRRGDVGYDETSSDTTTPGCRVRCCNSRNCRKWCTTYLGALTRVLIREVTSIAGPVAMFVGVGYALNGSLAHFTWVVAVIEFVCAVLISPPSYALGVLLGTLVERYCCRCGCVSTKNQQRKKHQLPTMAHMMIDTAPIDCSDDDNQSSRISELLGGPSGSSRSVNQPVDVDDQVPDAIKDSPPEAARVKRTSQRRLQVLTKVTPV